jgi:hypothetical protein
MNWQNIYRILKSDYLKLVLILALAFYVTLYPHLQDPYPLHLDEWNNFTYFQGVINNGSVSFSDPWYGGENRSYTSVEVGFHVFWAVFQRLSNIPLLIIFKYFPSVIFVITILAVFVMAKREGFGWEAAFFVSLMPTNIGVLGPALLVPVAMGLLFIPLFLFVAFNYSNWRSYLVLFFFMCLLLAVHAATAVGLLIIIFPYLLINLKNNFKHSLVILFVIIIPFFSLFPWIFDLLLPTAKSLFTSSVLNPHVDYPRVITDYGYIPIILCLIGILVLAIKGGKKNYSLAFALLALLLMLVTYFTFHYGVALMYQRGLVYTMFTIGIIAGAGLMWFRNIKVTTEFGSKLKFPYIMQNVGVILCFILIGLTLITVVPTRQSTRFYHMIDQEDYETFVWIKENVERKYTKAILDPWKATAFTAITGKNVFTRLTEAPLSSDEEAYEFLVIGSSNNTDFLKRYNISIVYTKEKVNNNRLTEIRKNVYLLKDVSNP